MSKANVCTTVVANNLCSGCGVCAAVCPQKTLTIEWNHYGEYIAVNQHDRCSAKCNLCLHVCPFAPESENEDDLGRKIFSTISGIQHRHETGYYLQSFVGYSNVHNQRANGSSGGLATWVLETLITNKIVDYVICVSPSSDKNKLFHFSICETQEQIRSCSKSSYYPVELSAVIQHVASEEGRYALIGLPCAIKAVRLAMQRNAALRKRIIYLMGIVCGQQKGKFFSEHVMTLKGDSPTSLSRLHFREKDPSRPASDYGLRYECEDKLKRHKENTAFWTEGMGHAWLARYFTLNACNYCDDLFSELADASFMDAWLPEYSKDWRGTSIALIRNPNILALVKNGMTDDELQLEPLEFDKVVQSQAGALTLKRKVLSKRLSWAARRNIPTIRKRVLPTHYNFSEGLAMSIEMGNVAQSKKVFLSLKDEDKMSADEFTKRMRRGNILLKSALKAVQYLSRFKRKLLR